MNGEFGEGYSPLPLSNDGTARRSTAVGYLDAATRRRTNLQIVDQTQARRILWANGRASGVEVRRNGAIETIGADNVFVSAGALHSPCLLMLSGIGPGDHLRRHGIVVKLDRPGVGSNLMDHPAIYISGYLQPVARHKTVLRRNYTYLRWSSLRGGNRNSKGRQPSRRSVIRAVRVGQPASGTLYRSRRPSIYRRTWVNVCIRATARWSGTTALVKVFGCRRRGSSEV